MRMAVAVAIWDRCVGPSYVLPSIKQSPRRSHKAAHKADGVTITAGAMRQHASDIDVLMCNTTINTTSFQSY